MKDATDTKTGDLLKSVSRQARYRAKKERDGYRQAAIWIHQESEQAGKEAARRNEPCEPLTQGAADPVSWAIGWTSESTK